MVKSKHNDGQFVFCIMYFIQVPHNKYGYRPYKGNAHTRHTHRKERLLRIYIIKKYLPEKSAIEIDSLPDETRVGKEYKNL